MYYRGAQAAIVVYDIQNQDSFQRAKTWVKELHKQVSENISFPRFSLNSYSLNLYLLIQCILPCLSSSLNSFSFPAMFTPHCTVANHGHYRVLASKVHECL